MRFQVSGFGFRRIGSVGMRPSALHCFGNGRGGPFTTKGTKGGGAGGAEVGRQETGDGGQETGVRRRGTLCSGARLSTLDPRQHGRTPKACVLLLLLAAGAPAAPQTQQAQPTARSFWADPAFKKAFMGSYGVNSDIEPYVGEEDRLKLDEITTLMETDIRGAQAELETHATEEANAIFDFTLGNIYFQRGELDKAAARYFRSTKKFPNFLRAHKNLGLIHARAGRFDAAIESLTKTVELGGADGTIFGLLGYSYLQKGQFASAESAYRNAVLVQPTVVDWKLGLGKCLFSQEKFGEAAALLSELIEKHADREDFWRLQASAYMGLKQPVKAAENFELLSRMGKAAAEDMMSLGDIYMVQEMNDLAARAYTRAVEMDPAKTAAAGIRGAEILAARGDGEQARKLLGAVRRFGEGKLDDELKKKAMKAEARIAVAEGQTAKAAEVLEELVKIDPLDGDALILLGQQYAGLGKNEKAVFLYERAAGIEGFEAEAKLRQGQLLVRMSKLEEAIPLLKRAQELKPRDSVAKYLEQVERLAKSRR